MASMMNGVNSMNALHINDKIQNLKENINNEIHHRILINNTGAPVLKDEQLFFLLLPFFEGHLFDENMKKNITSVGIVHSSLYEHEKIKEQSAEDKTQQLTVLSGDYYSGRYYEILAQTGNISLIRHLSLGIVARCEQQIKLYESNVLSHDEWLTYFEVIESELINQFYIAASFTQYTQLAKTALVIARIQTIIEQLQAPNRSFVVNQMAEAGIKILELQQTQEAYKQTLQELIKQSALQKETADWIKGLCLE